MTQPAPSRRPKHRRALLVALVAMVAVASCGDDGGDGSTNVDGAAQSLIDQDVARYRLYVVRHDTDDQTPNAPDAANLAARTPEGSEASGTTDFVGAVHEVELDVGGVSRTVVRHGGDLAVEQEAAGQEGSGWVAVSLGGDGGEPGILEAAPLGVLLALHDPGTVVAGLFTGAAAGAQGTGVVDASGYALVTLERSSVQDPFLGAALDRAGTPALQLHVWYDATRDDGRIERMAYDLRDVVSSGGDAAGAPGDGGGTEAGGLPGTGLHDPGGSLFLMIEFLDEGSGFSVGEPPVTESMSFADASTLLAVQLFGSADASDPAGDADGRSPDIHQTPANSGDDGAELEGQSDD